MSPHVSVIVPVLDRAYCVADAIASVLAQADVDLECIVVDDGSTDGTVSAVAAIAAADPRVRLVHRERGGPSAARNRGLAEASGTLVTFHDSDDLVPPGRLSRQLAALDSTDADGVFGRYERVDVADVELPEWLRERPDWSAGWSWTSVLTARGHLECIGGFDEDLRLGEDLDLIVRLREARLDIAAVHETYVLKRYFGDNLSYEIDRPQRPVSDLLRRHVARRRAGAP